MHSVVKPLIEGAVVDGATCTVIDLGPCENAALFFCPDAGSVVFSISRHIQPAPDILTIVENNRAFP